MSYAFVGGKKQIHVLMGQHCHPLSLNPAVQVPDL